MQIDTQLSLQDILSYGNLAELIDASTLARIGSHVKKGMEIDEESREDWTERHDRAMDLAMQVTDEKSWPWDGASNVIYPAITTGAMQFAARAMPSIVPGANLVKCKVNGDDSGIFEVDPQSGQAVPVVPPGVKAQKASNVSRHMSYQLLCEIENWEEDTDAMMQYLAIAGCAFRKVSYDNGVISKFLPGSQVVINMDAESVDSAARISECFYLHPYEVQERVARGEYFVDEGHDLQSIINEPDESNDDDQALVKLVEQHTRLDLDGDGYPEPYVVIFHKHSGHVFGIFPHFTPEDIEGDSFGGIVSIKHRPPYVKYDFLPNPNNGLYGIGLGWLLGPLNEQINTTINQLNDAGTLQNTPMGFVARGLRIKGGDFSFEPGEFKQVDVAGGNIRENLHQLQFAGPSPVLFNLLGLMIDATKDISSVKDIMTGGMEKNVAPTTAMTLVEQGSKQFNSIFKRIHRSLKKELRMLFEINARTLPQQSYFMFLDDQKAIAREDYDLESIDVIPVTDPTMATDAKKQARIQGLMQAAQMFGPLMNQQKLFMDVMEGLEVENPQEYFQQPQPQGPSPDQQAKLMKSQADMVRAQADERNAQTDAVLALATFMEKNSSAILNIARAEGEEEGRQLEQYIAQLRDLRMEMKEDDQNRIRGVAGAPNNPQNPQNPAQALSRPTGGLPPNGLG